jgi:hypothetical protein
VIELEHQRVVLAAIDAWMPTQVIDDVVSRRDPPLDTGRGRLSAV